MAKPIEGVGLRGLILFLAISAHAAPKRAVWIDTDPSVARGEHEIDDGIALLQAFASPELDIRGISIVYGNADLPTASRIGKELVSLFGPKKMRVFIGAGGPKDLGRETEASRALAKELARGRLTIVALGPATNVATVVKNHPELVKNIEQAIAVAGRRPGQQFIAGPKQKIPFRDLNFELDPEAFRVLLASKVPIVLAPWEISSQVWITREDMQAAAKHNRGMAWLLPAAEDWLAMWGREFGAPGFNPFDALAIGYVTNRGDMECGPFAAAVEVSDKPYLIVRPAVATQREVTYCFAAKPGFKTGLLKRLSSGNLGLLNDDGGRSIVPVQIVHDR